MGPTSCPFQLAQTLPPRFSAHWGRRQCSLDVSLTYHITTAESDTVLSQPVRRDTRPTVSPPRTRLPWAGPPRPAGWAPAPALSEFPHLPPTSAQLQTSTILPCLCSPSPVHAPRLMYSISSPSLLPLGIPRHPPTQGLPIGLSGGDITSQQPRNTRAALVLSTSSQSSRLYGGQVSGGGQDSEPCHAAV